jgi:hypothetical protein
MSPWIGGAGCHDVKSWRWLRAPLGEVDPVDTMKTNAALLGTAPVSDTSRAAEVIALATPDIN